MSNRFSKESKQRLVKGAINSAEIQKERKKIRVEKYDTSPVLCKFCGGKIRYEEREKIFCNNSCAAKFNNKGVDRHYKDRVNNKKEKSKKEIGKNKNKAINFCLYCKKVIYSPKFCNSRCQSDYRWKKKKESIVSGEQAYFESMKRYLLEINGNKCEICGITEWNNKKIVMILDHINGNSENNSLSNLRLVCPNCDSQLPTYKSKNKGNGRYSRRKRYAEGKSY